MDFNYGEVSSDNGYIDYSKRVKVAETDFESVYFGEINNGMYMQFSQDLSIYNTRKEILRISPNESGV